MSDPRFIRKELSDKLTPEQRYALVMLMEECAEVAVFCSKALRWGFDSRNPFSPEDGTNIEQINRELVDVAEAAERLEQSLPKPLRKRRAAKRQPRPVTED